MGRLNVEVFLERLDGRAEVPATAARTAYGRFATVIPHIDPFLLRWALNAAGAAVDLDDALDVYTLCAEHVALTAAPALRDAVTVPLMSAALRAAPATATEPAAGLVFDARLHDLLPLCELAGDIAANEPSGALVVHADPLRRVHGLFTRTEHASIVLLADHLDETDLAAAWAHELAHALDPELDAVHPFGAERFAERLADRLLDSQPSSRGEAAPLVEATAAACAPVRPWWPPAEVATVVEWAIDSTRKEAA